MALPKVIVQLYPMFPSDGVEDRKAKRTEILMHRLRLVHDEDAFFRENFVCRQSVRNAYKTHSLRLRVL